MPDQEKAQRRILRERLDARFRGPLMSFFMRRLSSRTEAEDLTQEVFMRILATDTRIAIEQADGLIFKVAGNLLRDRYRTHARRPELAPLPIEEEALTTLSREAVEERDPERVVGARQSLDAALSLLDELGERTKDIFMLVRLENMKHRDVAALFGISVSMVEKHVIRATMHLALHMTPEQR